MKRSEAVKFFEERAPYGLTAVGEPARKIKPNLDTALELCEAAGAQWDPEEPEEPEVEPTFHKGDLFQREGYYYYLEPHPRGGWRLINAKYSPPPAAGGEEPELPERVKLVEVELYSEQLPQILVPGDTRGGIAGRRLSALNALASEAAARYNFYGKVTRELRDHLSGAGLRFSEWLDLLLEDERERLR